MTISLNMIRKEIKDRREKIDNCKNDVEKDKIQREIDTLERLGARISISDVATRMF